MNDITLVAYSDNTKTRCEQLCHVDITWDDNVPHISYNLIFVNLDKMCPANNNMTQTISRFVLLYDKTGKDRCKADRLADLVGFNYRDIQVSVE